MKKVALVFALAVVAPSLVLAWLSVRSLRDQELVVERQRTLLYQGVADSVAKDVTFLVSFIQQDFNNQVKSMISRKSPREIAGSFDDQLRREWKRAEVGFVVSLDGQVLAPSPFAGPEARRFRVDNDRFLCSRESVEVYWNSPKGAVNLTKLDQKEARGRTSSPPDSVKGESPPTPDSKEGSDAPAKDLTAVKTGKSVRTVVPEKEPLSEPFASKSAPEEAAFQQIVRDSVEGTLARFLQDKLKLLFWYRPQIDPQLVFGAQINLTKLGDELRPIVRVEPALHNEICVALLDDTGKPVALSHPAFRPGQQRPHADLRPKQILIAERQSPRNSLHQIGGETQLSPTPQFPEESRPGWKRPFVATEIGEVLPHWEVGVYLLNPASLRQSATTLRLTLGLLIGLLVLAIAVGSWLIAADLRRQLTLARQKTDFVSNVSHELKTPLTSIRMFSEMLAEGRVQDEGKRRQFLSIITAETARLTRLINTVLDFARLERGDKKYQFGLCDAGALVAETIDSYRPHLEANGFELTATLPRASLPIKGDRDALAQIFVNLLSNAEKYCGERKNIEVRVESVADAVEIQVLDRGLGVPKECEERIFEQFFRAHDSLASGIQGSGLGLTLARQIARAHGGDVTYRAREGGGSCFVLRLPKHSDNAAAT